MPGGRAAIANRYWVGGTASWDATAGSKWSLTSGGAGGEAVPTNTDDVFFDAASGASTVTVAASAVCLNLSFAGFTGTFAGSSALAISGSLVLAAAMTRTYTGAITFNATTAQTITSNTKTLASAITFNGSGGSWALQDALSTTGNITVTAGTFNQNGFDATCAKLGSGGGTQTVTSGGGQVNFTFSGAGGDISISSANMTFTDRPTWNFIGTPTSTTTIGYTGGTEAVAPDINIMAGTGSTTWNTGGAIRNLTFGGTFVGTWANTSSPLIYGNLTLKAGMTVTGGANGRTFGATSGTKTITSAGLTLDFPLTFNGVGGTWQFADAFVQGSTRTLTLTNGTLDGNSQNVSVGSFALGAGTKTLTLGSGTWTVLGAGASAWNALTNVANLTVTASTGKISLTSASAKTFAGGAKTWPVLDQGGTGDLTVTGANSFGDVQWSAAGKIILPASTTTTVSLFTGPVAVAGTLESSLAGTAATLSKASGTVSVSSLSIKDSAATGGATFNAPLGSGNTDVSGNTGWLFSSSTGLGSTIARTSLALSLSL